ncbi:MAG TPA: hypothetical protein DHN33_05095, partial [Eubacteriaceae bacterium]|nr:hypothetical protein [Eubacteriaceae bacterium]
MIFKTMKEGEGGESVNKRNKKEFCIILIVVLLALFSFGCACSNETLPDETQEPATKDEEYVITEPGTIILGEKYEKIVVQSENVTLKDGTVKWIEIASQVGDGDVTLSNIQAEELEIKGGGENSIYLTDNSNVSRGKAARKEGPVRIHVDGTSSIQNMIVDKESKQVTLEGEINDVEIIENDITILATDLKSNHVTISGENVTFIASQSSSIEELTVETRSVLQISGNITTLNMGSNAGGTTIEIPEGIEIDTLYTDVDVTIIGGGTVGRIISRNTDQTAQRDGINQTQQNSQLQFQGEEPQRDSQPDYVPETPATTPKYILSFNSNGGSYIDAMIAVQENIPVGTLASPEKKGYAFDGWFREEFFQNRFTVEDSIDEDTVLYAKWTPLEYSVVYRLDGGVNAPDRIKKYTIEMKTAQLKTPTKENHSFLGWYTKATGGEKKTEIVQGSTGDIELFARWKQYPSIEINRIEVSARNSIYVYMDKKDGLIFNLKEGTILDQTFDSGRYKLKVDELEIDQEYVLEISKQGHITYRSDEIVWTALMEAKGKAKQDIIDASNGYDEDNYVPENWILLVGFKEDGISSINVADTIEEVEQLKEQTLSSMDQVQTIIETIELAEQATSTAEETKVQEDVEYALILVNSLPEGNEKDGLLERIQAVQNAIDEEKANDVEDRINELPNISEIVLTDREDVVEARNEYDALSGPQKNLVANIDVLLALEGKIADMEAANEVEQQIDALPSVDALQLSDQGAVEAARTVYDELSESQKGYVTNEAKLQAAEEKLQDLGQAAQVDSMIEALPSLEDLLLSHKGDVEGARTAYDALTDSQKSYVTRLEKLAELEEKMHDLVQAFQVDEQIDALPSVDALQLSDQGDVEAARTAYDGLSESQKGYVQKLDQLIQREEQIQNLQAADAVDKTIQALPTVEELILSDRGDVEAARAAYDALSQAQKSLVGEGDKLLALEGKIADMEAANEVEQQIDALPTVDVLQLSDQG